MGQGAEGLGSHGVRELWGWADVGPGSCGAGELWGYEHSLEGSRSGSAADLQVDIRLVTQGVSLKFLIG